MTRYPDDLPEEDRAKCLMDEMLLGESAVELTDDGPRRVDPTEATTLHE